MSRWERCRTERERRDLLEQVLRETAGNVTRAATLLGITRRHLTRLLRQGETKGRTETMGLTETSETRETTETSSLTETSDASETATHADSLTYRRARPRFPAVSTPSMHVEEKASLNLPDLPRSCKEWLEDQALLLKRKTGASRASMTAVVVQLIQREREREAGER